MSFLFLPPSLTPSLPSSTYILRLPPPSLARAATARHVFRCFRSRQESIYAVATATLSEGYCWAVSWSSNSSSSSSGGGGGGVVGDLDRATRRERRKEGEG